MNTSEEVDMDAGVNLTSEQHNNHNYNPSPPPSSYPASSLLPLHLNATTMYPPSPGTGSGVPTKPLRLTVFGKPYSVPLRKVNTEAGILDYLNTLPQVVREKNKLGNNAGHGLRRLFNTETWEFRNEEGDTVRIDDWSDMVYASSRISLVSNVDGGAGRRSVVGGDTSKGKGRDEADAMAEGNSRLESQFQQQQQLGDVSLTPHSPCTNSLPPSVTSGSVSGSNSVADHTPLPVIIHTYYDITLPSPYPPPPEIKMTKHSFGPTTTYGKALRAICGVDARLEVCRVALRTGTVDEKYLISGRVVENGLDETLEKCGFVVDREGGSNEYLTRVVMPDGN